MSRLNRWLKNTVNLSNSIIGVSILAMPLCFKQCGLVLSVAILCLSVVLNQFSCHLLLKSAIINRRRNYELLAFDVFGSSGKTLVEVCILLFLLGTCIAFFVIVGEIGPSLVANILGVNNGPHLNALVVTVLAMFVIFPLGLLRNVENLTSFSMMSLLVYLFLALRMISLAFDKLFLPSSLNIWQEVTYWNSSGLISYLPIFSMALSCQSQVFEIYHQDLFQADMRSLKHIMFSTKRALYISSGVYLLIGFFGYVAFYDVNLSGSILQTLPTGFLTQVTLLLFMITLLTSFPLCLFPCRTSLHSLLFRKGGYNDLLSTAHSVHMSDYHFRLLTIVLIVTTMGVSVIFPHVELILALVGSTIGSIICFIIPALLFIKLSDKNTIEYLLAYLLIFFGMVILIFCTFSTLHSISLARDVEIEEKINEIRKSTVTSLRNDTPQSADSLSIAKVPRLDLPPLHSNQKFKDHLPNDLKKFKNPEDLLQRLERHDQEHLKLLKEQRDIINELKKHDKVHHEKKVPGDDANKTTLETNSKNLMPASSMKITASKTLSKELSRSQLNSSFLGSEHSGASEKRSAVSSNNANLQPTRRVPTPSLAPTKRMKTESGKFAANISTGNNATHAIPHASAIIVGSDTLSLHSPPFDKRSQQPNERNLTDEKVSN